MVIIQLVFFNDPTVVAKKAFEKGTWYEIQNSTQFFGYPDDWVGDGADG